jgi:hypothetical protein
MITDTNITYAAIPELRNHQHDFKSQRTWRYNCYAYAIHITCAFFDPYKGINTYWIEGVPENNSKETMVLFFSKFGFKECINGELEAGKQKIALYLDKDGNVSHAARQEPSGIWASKLGPQHDIVHENLECLESVYGVVWKYMYKRKSSKSIIRLMLFCKMFFKRQKRPKIIKNKTVYIKLTI